MIRVIVVDDHTLFRAGLRNVLDTFDEIRVVAEASNASQAFDAARHAGADLAICDLTIPGVSGAQLIEALHLAHPNLPILVLSMHDEPSTVRRALLAGAKGYLTKQASPESLHEAIEKVTSGLTFISPELANSLAFDSISPHQERHASLTGRENEILQRIINGMPLSQIADQLHLSPKTVTTHKTNIMEKLGVANNADLIRYAVEHKLFEDEQPLPKLNPRS